MPCTIFYSWQSDTDPKTNHHFLKDCLKDALALLAAGDQLEEVIRGDELHLDHDTKGVFGDVEVFNTILQKISACDLFVADITIVATTPARKQCPNPNVLLELGYALDVAGAERTLKVMNEHYGLAKDGLPFDMAHKRFPCCYRLAPDADEVERKKVKKQVTRELADIIGGMLREAGAKSCPPLEFNGVAPAWKSSSFIDGDLLGRDDRSAFGGKPTNVYWRNGPQWFLRVIPHTGLPEMTSKKVIDLLNTHKLLPLGRTSGFSSMPNAHGGVCYDIPVNGNPVHRFTQLFSNGEIWGIEQPSSHASANSFIPFAPFVSSLSEGLDAYLCFMRDQLGITPPLQIVAGLSDIINFRIADKRFWPGDQYAGLGVKDEVISEPIVIKSYDVTAEDLLGPFFQKVWEEFGLDGNWNQ